MRSLANNVFGGMIRQTLSAESDLFYQTSPFDCAGPELMDQSWAEDFFVFRDTANPLLRGGFRLSNQLK
jgi:hypothetical protein